MGANDSTPRWTDKIRRWLGRDVDGSALGLFRIVWGLLMIYEGFRKLPKADGIYSPYFFHFKYAPFPFVEPLPEVWMVRAEIWVMIACAALVALGIRFRLANTLFAVIYTHLFLTDKLYFNNHFYLTLLLAFLLSFTQADRCYSVSSWWRERQGKAGPWTVPFWNLVLLRGQIIIVYFFGGIAKINSDWLAGEPLRHWFGTKPVELIKAPISWFPGILHQEWFVWLLSYGGMIFDLCVGFMLLHRRTFWPAVIMLFGFHVTNNALFKIGIFPFLGLGMISIFFPPDGPRRFFARVRTRFGKGSAATPTASSLADRGRPASITVTALVLAYLTFHSVFPLRFLIYGQNPSWSEVGHYFSWRMMLRDKDSYIKFHFEPPEAERLLEKTDQLPNTGEAHIRKMVDNPHFILQYAHALDETFKRLGERNVEIRAMSIVSLNGRPFQLMLDPTVDLTKVSYGFFGVPDWIVPLKRNGRPGLYPASVEERMKWIMDVYREEIEKPPVSRPDTQASR